MKKIIDTIGKQNLILIFFILCVVLIPCLYATFSLSVTNEGISIIDGIKTMKFILGEKEEENTIIIAGNSHKNIEITISNQEDIKLQYGIYYESEDDLSEIELGYHHNTENLPKGLIGARENKVITIRVENNTDDIKTITFGLIYGLENGGDLIVEENQKFLEQEVNFPLNEANKGSYISYIGNNGCTEEQCLGKNANDPEDKNTGYCGDETEKYKENGWKIAYIRNGITYITTAGAPECLEIESDVPTLLKKLNEIALNYCSIDYAYRGECNEKTSWAMNTNDFYQITGNRLQEELCLDKENPRNCGYQNDIINTGSSYWLSNITKNELLYYQSKPLTFSKKETNLKKGLRPVLKLDNNIIITDGTGTKEDPYKIKNTKVPNYEYTIVYNGNGSTGGDTEDSIHRTNELKKLNKNNFSLSYQINLSEFATFDNSYCEDNGTCHEADIHIDAKQEAKFLGWSINPEDKKPQFQDEQEVINLSPSSNEIIVNLYAIWEYTALKLPEIQEREGYEILGWYTDKTAGEKVGNPGEDYTETRKITLYARWQKKSS